MRSGIRRERESRMELHRHWKVWWRVSARESAPEHCEEDFVFFCPTRQQRQFRGPAAFPRCEGFQFEFSVVCGWRGYALWLRAMLRYSTLGESVSERRQCEHSTRYLIHGRDTIVASCAAVKWKQILLHRINVFCGRNAISSKKFLYFFPTTVLFRCFV